jgi:hypothetical protein
MAEGAVYNRFMFLNLPLILETRRNHALEHATLHVLARKFPTHRMAGHSNPTGFYLLGALDAQEIWSAATEALTRLRAGESKLAIHAGCGTNLATSAILAGAFAWIPLRATKSLLFKILLLPLAVTLAAFGYLLSQGAGPWLQANVTTEANLGDLRILDIIPVRKELHRIITR